MDHPCDDTLHHALAFDKAECMFVGMSAEWESRVVRWKKPFSCIGYLKIAYRVLRNSSPNDIIICWNFRAGIFAAALTHILLRRRIIISLNLDVGTRKGAMLWAKSGIYNWLLKDENFHCSIYHKDVLKAYGPHYRIDPHRVFELNGCYKYYPLQISDSENYIFCCGRDIDWNTYFRTALLLPEVRFIAVTRKKLFNPDNFIHIPKNVEMVYDIKDSEVCEYLSRCALVCLPVEHGDTKAGLVMYHSALMNKPIICSRTPSFVSMTVDGDTEGALFSKVGDYQNFVMHISDLLREPWRAELYTRRMRQLMESFSPYNFSQQLLDYVRPLQQVKAKTVHK